MPSGHSNFMNKTKCLHKVRAQLPLNQSGHQLMTAVSLLWDTNMSAVTSCENTLYIGKQLCDGTEGAFLHALWAYDAK